VNGSGGTISPLPTPSPTPTNSPPTASFTYKCQKANCTFDGSKSTDDQGVASYEWTFGDGASSVTSGSPITSHSYLQRGNYVVTVSLKVSDAMGLSATVQKSIQIKNGGR
jgi:PKD repeat protein